MSQCLRCRKPCEAASIFCESCRLQLRSQLWEEADTLEEPVAGMPPVVTMSPVSPDLTGGEMWVGEENVFEPVTNSHAIVAPSQAPEAPKTPLPSVSFDVLQNLVDPATQNLSEAAQRIEQIEPGNRKKPRISRLSPLRDISADIRRESTPLPNMRKSEKLEAEEDLGKRIPDLWPWLHDIEQEENEHDAWSNRTDPLVRRQFPNSFEVAQIEEEDIRRAKAEGLPTNPLLPRIHRPSTRVRRAFILLAIMVALFVVADGILLTFTLLHNHRPLPVVNGPPTLKLSSNTARMGQIVTLHIRSFTPMTRVYLTHDVQEQVTMASGGTPLINIGLTGSADASMLIDTSWGPGFHTVQAEDVQTRYTASATLQIVGAGPTRPSHLLVGTTTLDLGADIEGSNTIQPLTLHNSGDGAVTWSGSSNQPWLLLSPTQGRFSSSQTIAVAGQRANLKPGDYTAVITLYSNVGPAIHIDVTMTVRPLPANAGPVLQITPAALSFTAVDGGGSPTAQLLTISNPGSQPLNWSLAGNTPLTPVTQGFLLDAFDMKTGWLTTNPTSGSVLPHSTASIQVLVNSSNLLPGVYTDTLQFGGSRLANGPQSVSISLTVQPRCSLTINTASMSFTAIAGQSTQSNRSLSFSAAPSCTGAVKWSATSDSSWLTITPASGQLKASAGAVTSVGVNAATLAVGHYTGSISFIAGQSTYTVAVILDVQAPPPPNSPVLGAAPLSVNFITTQGAANPPAQVVTITNSGSTKLYWTDSWQINASTWLGANPAGGRIAPGQTGQLNILVDTSNLTPGTYSAQVTITGTDASGNTAPGSPQTVTVSLTVNPPCSLTQPSSGSLDFSGTEGGSDPVSQMVTMTATGNCLWPVSWHASTVDATPAWLKMSPAGGTFTTGGQTASISVGASLNGLAPGTYSTKVQITASDSANTAAQGSPQFFTVTLTVAQPCTLNVPSNLLSFSVAQGQAAPAAQSFSISETGNCALPVSWSVVGDSGSAGWLGLSPGTGSNSGSVSVSITSTSLAPGNYTGTITVSARGSGGATVLDSPVSIPVTLIITGYTLSGQVLACADSACSTSQPLGLATVTLLNNAGNTVATMTADASGGYSFNNLGTGTYTIQVTGTSGGSTYTGNQTDLLSGNQSNVNVNTFTK